MDSSSFDPIDRCPPSAGSGDDPPGLAGLVAELRALPRWVAPRGPESALTFAAVMERVDEARLDARLAAEETAIRRLLRGVRGLEPMRAPSSLVSPIGARPTRPLLLLPRAYVRHVVLAAAAVLMVAALLPRASRTRPKLGSLAAQTAALSDRATLAIEVRYANPRRGGP